MWSSLPTADSSLLQAAPHSCVCLTAQRSLKRDARSSALALSRASPSLQTRRSWLCTCRSIGLDTLSGLNTHTYTHAHTYTRTHTHTHTYVHTQQFTRVFSLAHFLTQTYMQCMFGKRVGCYLSLSLCLSLSLSLSFVLLMCCAGAAKTQPQSSSSMSRRDRKRKSSHTTLRYVHPDARMTLRLC